MTELQRRLKDADPLAVEAPLDVTDVQRIRQDVLATAAARRGHRSLGRLAAWGTAAAAVLIGGGISLYESPRAVTSSQPAVTETSADRSNTPVLRQLHFSTAGGTRVVWLFNPDFEE